MRTVVLNLVLYFIVHLQYLSTRRVRRIAAKFSSTAVVQLHYTLPRVTVTLSIINFSV